MQEHVARIIAVTKVYQKNKAAPPVHALRGIDLDIPRGQYLSIMGPSGSGKSTLMNIVGCLDRPTEGQYLLDGDDVAQMDDEQLSKVRGKRLGFVFQAFNLIPQLTVLDNVVVPLFYQGISASERRDRAEAVLKRVELGDRMMHRPNQLSGGQMQRVAIARALVTGPQLVLADEPTANLDSKTSDQIIDLMLALNRDKGVTFLFSTHDPRVMEHARRVVSIHDGVIVDGTAAAAADVARMHAR